jgi:hypothetical protein
VTLSALGIFSAAGSAPPLVVEYLVIAGGGSGGCGAGGGGGAGGYRSSVIGQTSGANSSAESTLTLTALTNYTVTIGAGGAARSGADAPGFVGVNSTFSTITSSGGGRGAAFSGPGGNGGSGGGSSVNSTGGSGTANQGLAGEGSAAQGGGGGGAAESGATDGAGFGGDGLSSNITGTAVFRAGGGGGVTGAGTSGGDGGGGNCTQISGPNYLGSDGTVNTGSGGGGSNGGQSTGAGGSGVVILRYDAAYTLTIGAGLTGSTATVGGQKVTTITQGTGNVSWAA